MSDDLELHADVFELIRAEGVARYPNEACGLIVQVGKKSLGVVCENIAENPQHRFRIAAADYARCAQRGKVVGVWHTHTDECATPSEADKAMCEASGLPWYIVGIIKEGGGFRFDGPVSIEPNGYETPYVGRPYVMGIHDCYTLVCDYYKREFGIPMKRDYPRIEDWWNKGHNFFSENFANEGFIDVTGQEPQVGDIFMMQVTSPVASHVGIYLGDDVMLHHCHGRLSTRDIYGGYWAKHTVNHLRHKLKC